MKFKADFITNSSSTSYILNVYKDGLTAKEFVNKMWELVIQPGIHYYNFSFSKTKIINSLNKDYDYFPSPKCEDKVVTFGDEFDNIAGIVFDYVLRDGFSCEDFAIKFYKMNR